ncbi:hypothetical protein PanWU01x14_056940 [Parasponia andersonii]|uniref:Uncharacterized protein n=1 Tax=Parasponia andersonii TaxID=3476 RepID=A0A2P5DJN6_PARAD|nr:hypothetical protein PanWU01x14_056940 [Parasponia andersonii]
MWHLRLRVLEFTFFATSHDMVYSFQSTYKAERFPGQMSFTQNYRPCNIADPQLADITIPICTTLQALLKSRAVCPHQTTQHTIKKAHDTDNCITLDLLKRSIQGHLKL